jgi:hypothetical protein
VDRGAVRQVLRHHKELAFRAPALLWEASKVWTTLIAILSLYLLLNKKLAAWGYNLIGTVSPWWALVSVGILFLEAAPIGEYRMCQAAIRRPCNLSERCHVRKVTRLLA